MPLWKKTDQANSAPINTPSQFHGKANTANRDAMYANTTNVANGIVAGTFAVSPSRKANTNPGEGSGVAHAGWNLRKAGTGPLLSITVSAGGTGYSNTDTIKVVPSGSNGVVNAATTLTTNSTGGIVSVTVTNPGAGFTKKNPTGITVANSTGGATAGSGATLVATAGGRAGRVHYETLVAMGSMTTADNNLP